MSYLGIFGAGNDQLPTYRMAAEMGLSTIGFDMRPDAPGRDLADIFAPVDVRDVDGAVAVLRDHEVVGLVSPAVDRGIPTVREAALQLGLPCTLSKRAAVCSVSKPAFRSLIDELGLPAYRSVEAAVDVTGAELSDVFRELELPVVVKPIDSSGTKGVTLVERSDQIEPAVAEARVFASDGSVVIEEFVSGRHLSIEAFLRDGQVVVPVLAERIHAGPPTLATLANHVPPAIADKAVEAIWADAHRIVSALELTDGPIIFDVVLDSADRPYFVEMAARIGGNGMPGLVWATKGVDTIRANIDLACGRQPDLTPTRDSFAAQFMLAAEVGGRVAAIDIPDEVIQHPALARLEVLVAPGDEIRPYRRAPDTAGYALVAGEADLEATVAVAADLISRISVTMTDPDQGTVACTWRTP